MSLFTKLIQAGFKPKTKSIPSYKKLINHIENMKEGELYSPDRIAKKLFGFKNKKESGSGIKPFSIEQFYKKYNTLFPKKLKYGQEYRYSGDPEYMKSITVPTVTRTTVTAAKDSKIGKAKRINSDVIFPSKEVEERYLKKLTEFRKNPLKTPSLEERVTTGFISQDMQLAEEFLDDISPAAIKNITKINGVLYKKYPKRLKKTKSTTGSAKANARRKQREEEGLKTLSPLEKNILKRQIKQRRLANGYFRNNPEKFLENPKLKRLLDVSLNKDGSLNFDPRYDSYETYIKKIKENAFDIYDITPVRSEKANIMFPGNKLLTPSKFNRGFTNQVQSFHAKTLGSTDPEVIAKKNAIDNFLKEVNLPMDTMEGRIGAKPLPAFDSITKSLPNIDSFFKDVGFESLIDTSKFKEGGRVGMDEGGMTFDEMIQDNMENHGMELKDAIEFTVKEMYGDKAIYGQGGRVGMNEGGRVKLAVGGMSDKRKRSLESLTKNKVGTLESMLAGVGSGLIDIPKGAFTLGAALLDLGLGTSNAAKVERYFDDLTGLDEKAEATFMGNLTKIMVNLGVPGGIAAKKGAELTTKALLAKKNGNYFKLTDPRLQEKFKTSLNAKGRLFATLGAAGAAGVADAVFVGDPEHVGTIGDLFGGPTQLLENDENSAAREVINRLKFGADTSLLMGVVGGSGSAIKSIVRRRNELESNNDAIDKFLGAFRPRGMTSQEFFDLQRKNIGARAGDINYASQVSRSLDKHIDAIFPYAKNVFNKEGNKGRREFMAKLNDTLLSGGIDFDDATKQVRFGEMNAKKVNEITSMMKAKGGKPEDIQGVLDAFGDIRGGWGHMFTRLGGAMDDAAFAEFSSVFGNKFKDYLGATYDVFRNNSLIPLFNYKPSAEAVEKTVKVFREAAEAKGTPITKEEAEYYVSKVIDSARPARKIATRADETSGVYFNVPDFFVNNSTISDIEKIGVGRTTVPLDALTDSVKPVFDEVLGKIQDPMQTILTGTNKLSLVSRRNEFFQTLKNENASIGAARKAFLEDPENAGKVLPPELRGFFRETELEAMNELGKNVKQIKIDESRSIEAGITNPLHDLYAERGVAEAIEEAGMLAKDNGTLKQLYDNFVLYPKATSQMAKTILSPITHARNFISAGAFATANGLIPGLTVSIDDSRTAFKEAFGMLQTNIPGTRQANDRYRELLRLGVVNSGVKLGDLQKLLNDVNFGESFTGTQQLKDQMRKLSKVKKWTEDMYTAEDDFWKISSFAMERGRLKKVYDKYNMKYTDDLLDNEAAEIVRNNIPNYDMVSSFVKSLRQLPFGNFVSFPAEIYRTSFNIMGRIMKEFNTPHTLDDGRTVYPFRSIAMKRALGFGTTVVGVPYATVEGMKAIYNVTEDEMQALRRFVPEWSKNSTLVPVRGDDGDLKYIDFSHANAYDAMIRPWTTMFNGLQKGIAEEDIKKELFISMIDATKETASPFVSESIWTSAIADISPILGRNGRTQSGRRLWTDETPIGDIFMESIKHLGATVVPGSLPAVIRMKQAVTEEVDEYGRTYEFLDEALGIAGFRAVQVDPVAAMKFKIADFRTGLNDARREFTGPLLKGGPVSAEQIVDQYLVANQAMHRVQKRMFDDYYAARTLGASTEKLNKTFADRVSDTQLRAIRAAQFKPFVPSENIEQAFRDNARAIGEPDNYRRAREFIKNLVRRFNRVSLVGDLPLIENPFRTSLGTRVSEPFSGLTTQPLQDLGLTSPTIGTNLNQTAARGQQVFGSTDPIFGS